MSNRLCCVVLVLLVMVMAFLVAPERVGASSADSLSVSPLFRASSDKGATELSLNVEDWKTRQDSTGWHEAIAPPINGAQTISLCQTYYMCQTAMTLCTAPCCIMPDTLPLMTTGGFLACSAIVALVALLFLVRRRVRGNT